MRTHRKAVQERFVEPVRLGIKRTTIRPVPRRSSDIPQEGDILELYRWTGKPYRSKQEVIGRFRVVTDGCGVTVKSDRVVFHNIFGDGEDLVAIDNAECSHLTTVAKREGFHEWPDMAAWYRNTHGLPYTGIIIGWEELR